MLAVTIINPDLWFIHPLLLPLVSPPTVVSDKPLVKTSVSEYLRGAPLSWLHFFFFNIFIFLIFFFPFFFFFFFFFNFTRAYTYFCPSLHFNSSVSLSSSFPNSPSCLYRRHHSASGLPPSNIIDFYYFYCRSSLTAHLLPVSLSSFSFTFLHPVSDRYFVVFSYLTSIIILLLYLSPGPGACTSTAYTSYFLDYSTGPFSYFFRSICLPSPGPIKTLGNRSL